MSRRPLSGRAICEDSQIRGFPPQIGGTRVEIVQGKSTAPTAPVPKTLTV